MLSLRFLMFQLLGAHVWALRIYKLGVLGCCQCLRFIDYSTLTNLQQANYENPHRNFPIGYPGLLHHLCWPGCHFECCRGGPTRTSFTTTPTKRYLNTGCTTHCTLISRAAWLSFGEGVCRLLLWSSEPHPLYCLGNCTHATQDLQHLEIGQQLDIF